MVSQKKKRDILDELLNTPSDSAPPGAEELEKLIHRTPPASPAPARGKRLGKGAPRGKKKTTHYLSGEIFWELNKAKEKINELVPSPLKSRVSKSQIVNQALKMILADFEQKGERSTLIEKLLENSSANGEEK